jgi:hypothetical protein
MICFVDIFAMKVPSKERPRKFWLSAKDIHHPSLYVNAICFVHFCKENALKRKTEEVSALR